ncbi:MAG: hypothetical protein D6714_02895, partial [Bacteroidetes bacterium]
MFGKRLNLGGNLKNKREITPSLTPITRRTAFFQKIPVSLYWYAGHMAARRRRGSAILGDLFFWGKNEWFDVFWAPAAGSRFADFRRRGSRVKIKSKFKFKFKSNLF